MTWQQNGIRPSRRVPCVTQRRTCPHVCHAQCHHQRRARVACRAYPRELPQNRARRTGLPRVVGIENAQNVSRPFRGYVRPRCRVRRGEPVRDPFIRPTRVCHGGRVRQPRGAWRDLRRRVLGYPANPRHHCAAKKGRSGKSEMCGVEHRRQRRGAGELGTNPGTNQTRSEQTGRGDAQDLIRWGDAGDAGDGWRIPEAGGIKIIAIKRASSKPSFVTFLCPKSQNPST